MIVMPLTATPTSTADYVNNKRWQAVLRRDESADDSFVYAVRTTGVYCRPSCAARRAKRKHVEFYSSSAQAEGEGFRACKRCRPNDQSSADLRRSAIVGACRSIEQMRDMPPDLDALAQAAGMSKFHFHRTFKAVTGVTPKAYAEAHRAKSLRNALSNGRSISETIYSSGFNSTGRFYAKTSKLLGMTPSAFRSGGAGESIQFAIGKCSLGAILIGSTEKGICAILLGDHAKGMIRELQGRFPKAKLIGAGKQLQQRIAKVIEFVEQPALGLDLPLDIRGTAFQQRVWQALRQIPAGSTTTYAQIARRIGSPKSVRAVAGACASNPIGVAIPCHRVIRTDGSLAGYYWRIKRKAELLKRERRAAGAPPRP